MPLHSLTVCEWSERRRKDSVLKDPTWSDIEAAIRRLDNKRFNDIYLHRDEDSEDFWLSVGGGSGRYLVTGASPDGFPTVVDRTRASLPDELLCVGGQHGYFPARWIQPLDVALKAVHIFFDTGEYRGPVEWEIA
jgi:hypothetical protein